MDAGRGSRQRGEDPPNGLMFGPSEFSSCRVVYISCSVVCSFIQCNTAISSPLSHGCNVFIA